MCVKSLNKRDNDLTAKNSRRKIEKKGFAITAKIWFTILNIMFHT